MDFNRQIQLILDNPANNLTESTIDMLETMQILLEAQSKAENLPISDVRVRLLEQKLLKAEKALNDIVKWDDELEEVWGDPGERANSVLEHNASLDGF